MELRLAETVGPVQAELLEQVGRLARELGTPAYLVGGAVRDALLGCPSLDLDVTVVGEAGPLAERLAQQTQARLVSHERFGTAVLELADLHLDLTTARRETYPQPGALPVVEPAGIEEDLLRRDFAVNTLAVRLDAEQETLFDPLGGYPDLQAGVLCGLHERTFIDDPTRMIRGARYAARFCWHFDDETLAWLVQAATSGAFDTVTGPRLWRELERLLLEETAPEAVDLLRSWGALAALGLEAGCPDDVVEVWSGAADVGASCSDRVLAALGLLAGPNAALRAEEYALTAAERHAMAEAAHVAVEPPPVVFAAGAKSSTLYKTLSRLSVAARLALWARHPQARANLLAFQGQRGACLDINGEDLQAEGFAPSPGFRVALEAALRVRLDDGADRARQLVVAREALEEWQQQHEF